jgi:hypothetical protein
VTFDQSALSGLRNKTRGANLANELDSTNFVTRKCIEKENSLKDIRVFSEILDVEPAIRCSVYPLRRESGSHTFVADHPVEVLAYPLALRKTHRESESREFHTKRLTRCLIRFTPYRLQ